MGNETKDMIVRALEGRTSPNKGNHYSPKLRRYLSKVQTERHASMTKEEESDIGRRSAKARKAFSLEQDAQFRKNLSDAVKQVHFTRTDREKKRIHRKIAASVAKAWENMPEKERRAKSRRLSRGLHAYWNALTADEQAEVKRKRLAKKSPNKVEGLLLRFVKKLGFKYVGNGKLWIERFNPDFVHKTKKIIIELFGIYWHQNDEKDKERLRAYRRAGYKTLVIWDVKLLANSDKQVMRVERLMGV